MVEAKATSMPPPVAEAPEDSPANNAPQSTSAPAIDAPSDPVPGQHVEAAGILGAAAPDSVEPTAAISHMDSCSDQSPDLGLASNAAEVSNSKADSASSVDATVIAWRPARKPKMDGKARRFRRNKAALPETDLPMTRRDSGSTPPSGDSDRAKERLRRRVPRASTTNLHEVGPPPLRSRGGSESAQADEKRRQAIGKRNAPAGGANFESQRRATVDQNSPFAKLLELRSILEAQDKNRS